jgi:dipeptidyl aminopeptidase/acylaminoacyl peptidase
MTYRLFLSIMTNPRFCYCTLLLFIFATLPVSAQQKRTLTPEDLVGIREVSDAQISPDGKLLAFVMMEPADPKKPEKARHEDIWMVPADGSEAAHPFAASPESDNSPRWSPDGRLLAFLSSRDGGQPQVWLMRLDGGDARKVTNSKAGVNAYKWSRDGRLIAFVAKDGPTDEAQRNKDQRDDAIEIDSDHKFSRLWVIGVGGGIPTLAIRQDMDVGDFDWSPDGSNLVASFITRDRVLEGRIGIFHRADGALLRELNNNSEIYPDGLVRWSPDGKSILFMESSPRKMRGWLSVVPAEGGIARPLAKDFPGTIQQCFWTPDSTHVLAAALTGTRAKLLRVDTVKGEIATTAEYLVPRPDFSVTADARRIAYVSETPNSPADVWTISPGDAARRLTHSNPQIDLIQLGTVTEVSWANRKDGVKLTGVLVTPPDYREGRAYPMVVEAHVGDQGWWAGWQGSWWQWAQLLSSRGYVVFLPNARGVTGQNWRLNDAIMDWGGAALDDILDGVDDLVARKVADPDRLGIGGWSNGGFMTAWAITHTKRFKAAVTYEPVMDLSLFWGKNSLLGWGEFFENAMGGTPNRTHGEYQAHSPLHFVGNCDTPLLILHGQQESVVSLHGSYAFYRELKSKGVEAVLVVYPREGHSVEERAHRLDLIRRMQAWFDEHLQRK